MELLKIERIEGDPPRLRIEGEIDLSTSAQLRTALEESLAVNPDLVVDMGAVAFFDAAGLRVILQVAAARNGDGPLPLLNAQRVARVLDLVGLSGLTSIVFRDAGVAHGG
jgi:anti-sigma B factor antagonist